MKIELKTLKGFRDFLPKEARKRQYVIDKLRSVFESYGFEPLETPALEYAEILEGKYGEEGERLMYKFEDKGGRKVALRYDQTVPLARVIAQYGNSLPLPFKRYQIQNVWRGENPQAGRFREFLQCDIDTVGTSSLLADAEIIEIAISSLEALGFKGFKVLINDRKVFSGLIEDSNKLPTIVRTIDKLKKNGQEKVIDEIVSAGIEKELAEKILQTLETQKPTDNINRLFDYLSALGISEGNFEFAPFLARGLDYYTSTIFEIEIEGYEAGSVCGGGRYDDLIGMFGGKQIPAVGCSFGFDRLIEAMEAQNLFPSELATAKVLVTVFSERLSKKSIEVASFLREQGINTEVYLDAEVKIEKQLKYADAKAIPYVVIIGPKEAENNSATVKNMKTGEQKTLKIKQIAETFR